MKTIFRQLLSRVVRVSSGLEKPTKLVTGPRIVYMVSPEEPQPRKATIPNGNPFRDSKHDYENHSLLVLGDAGEYIDSVQLGGLPRRCPAVSAGPLCVA